MSRIFCNSQNEETGNQDSVKESYTETINIGEEIRKETVKNK